MTWGTWGDLCDGILVARRNWVGAVRCLHGRRGV
eukprot:CAMPEP_0204323322 /NCGR_PEP_ID=MMETSP0469-20131031/9309_1 /ASSEMBLY_ACC=CAM_ASM_000384 /TAXON_ID=2969 /ORGANISM="Oxyrrhis marina" /LENGTH=33 /DNA_ID= /DNA_START= /DNA_END= /DNA_ORIENTATION=